MRSLDQVAGLFIGAPVALPNGRASAIGKQAVAGRIELTRLGLAGDTQADRAHHGGPERALLHYCARHYRTWQNELPQVAERFVPPGFGENLSSLQMDEESVCIGDIYRIGNARIQVAQPRSPCWKLNERFGVADLAQRVQDSQRCGWLYRVLEPGRLATGDAIELIERPHPGHSVAAVMRAVYSSQPDRARLRDIATLGTLSDNWRNKAERRLAGELGDANARLYGGD